jgi:hypothetical protein
VHAIGQQQVDSGAVVEPWIEVAAEGHPDAQVVDVVPEVLEGVDAAHTHVKAGAVVRIA